MPLDDISLDAGGSDMLLETDCVPDAPSAGGIDSGLLTETPLDVSAPELDTSD
jgi:hypothetical protein